MRKDNSTKPESQADTVIRLKGVTKSYKIHHEKPTLFEALMDGKNEVFYALNKINLEIYRGEKVAIIGRNGSGKTTLLKIIAGITAPTKGNVYTKGRVVSLLDPEAGFHLDFTGIQNIYLNGVLVGMKRSEITKKLSKIIQFAGIGRFIDVPIYTYSRGMRLRLGFAVAIHADPDILILDEGMGVGDENFNRKVDARIDELARQGKTVVIVTHWLDYVKQHADRVLIIKRGKIAWDGNKQLVSTYLKTDTGD